MNNEQLLESYFKKLGELIQSLRILEFLLRICILRKEESDGRNEQEYKKYVKELFFKLIECKEGEMIEENAITRENSLYNVIGKFNSYSEEFKIDHEDKEKLRKLRNALAHGRIMSKTKSFPIKLFNYKKVNGGMKAITAQKVDIEWLEQNLKFVRDKISRIMDTKYYKIE